MESSIYIMVDTLYYLKKGGRITPAAAALGTLLKLKPVLQIQGEKLDSFAKARTVKQAKKMMIDAMRNDFDHRFNDPEGKNIMLLGLDVLPEYRSQGLARELVRRYLERECGRGRKEIILTCLESKVAMYEKFGFKDKGIAQSTWGGEEWHEMSVSI